MKRIFSLIILSFSIISLSGQTEHKVEYKDFIYRTDCLIDTLNNLNILDSYEFTYYGSDSLLLTLNKSWNKLILSNYKDSYYYSRKYLNPDSSQSKLELNSLIDKIMLSENFIKSNDGLSFVNSEYINSLSDSSEYFTIISWLKNANWIHLANGRKIKNTSDVVRILNLDYVDKLDTLKSGVLQITISEIDTNFIDKKRYKIFRVEESNIHCLVTEFDDRHICTSCDNPVTGFYMHEIIYVYNNKTILLSLTPTPTPANEELLNLFYLETKWIIEKLKPYIN